MQKKIYIGGLPWELDRIGLLNYFKAVLDGNGMEASYELPFVSAPLISPNSAIKVVDVFVAMDRQTNKSRGFGFVTLELLDGDNADDVFNKIVDLLNGQILIGIRGPRELIVKEADPRTDSPGGGYGGNSNGGNGGGNRSYNKRESQTTNSDDGMDLNW